MMVENLRIELESMNINFEHVAITKEQIEQFRLGHLTNPDLVVMAKLDRDSNAAAFKEDNDGRLFQIELDALNALLPDDFIALLEDSVDRYFDESIHMQITEDSKHSTDTIWRQVRKAIKNFDRLVKIHREQKGNDLLSNQRNSMKLEVDRIKVRYHPSVIILH